MQFKSTIFCAYFKVGIFSWFQTITQSSIYLIDSLSLIDSKPKKAHYWSRICILISEVSNVGLIFIQLNKLIMSLIKKEEKPSKNKSYKVLVDGDKYEFNKSVVTGEEILIKIGKTPPECHTLYQKLKGRDFEKISIDEVVDLSNRGIEKFTVKPQEVFHYTLDEEPETTDSKVLSANQILQNGEIKPVEDYYLIEIDSSGSEISHKENPEAPIEMKCPGSKFVSVFRGEMPVS